MSIEIAGIEVNLPTMAASLAEVVARARRGRGFTLFTLNLDHLVKVRDNAAFREAYGRADLVTADGWPIVWLAGRRGTRLERTCGSDMVEPLCEAAAKAGLGLYFVGPGPAAQAKALARLTARWPTLIVSGRETPNLPAGFTPADPRGFDVEALAGRINGAGARLCFLSMGAPKQELLADALRRRCPGVGFLCVGAALDFIAGEVERAPNALRRLGLEWLWRLAGSPRRLFTRYARCAVLFAGLAIPALLGRSRPAPRFQPG